MLNRKIRSNARRGEMAGPDKEVRPEHVIPFDEDDEFKDF